MNLIPVIIFIFIVIVVWVVRNMKAGKAQILSDERKQKEDSDTAAIKKRLADKDILEQKEAGKLRAELHETERKAQEDRKFREDELRRKIEERKKRESELK